MAEVEQSSFPSSKVLPQKLVTRQNKSKNFTYEIIHILVFAYLEISFLHPVPITPIWNLKVRNAFSLKTLCIFFYMVFQSLMFCWSFLRLSLFSPLCKHLPKSRSLQAFFLSLECMILSNLVWVYFLYCCLLFSGLCNIKKLTLYFSFYYYFDYFISPSPLNFILLKLLVRGYGCSTPRVMLLHSVFSSPVCMFVLRSSGTSKVDLPNTVSTQYYPFSSSTVFPGDFVHHASHFLKYIFSMLIYCFLRKVHRVCFYHKVLSCFLHSSFLFIANCSN